MNGIPFYLPIDFGSLVMIVVGIIVMILIVLMLLRRGAVGGRVSGDFVIVLSSNGPAKSYPIEPVAPPRLYQYKKGSGEVCLLIADTPPIPFQGKKGVNNMFIAVESDILSLALNPGTVDVISTVSGSTKSVSVDDVIDLVSYMLEKKSESDAIVVPPNIRVAFTYKYNPAGISIIEDLLRSDASILSTVIANLRAAQTAKELAQAVAIRAGAEAKRWTSIAIMIVMITIGIAVALAILGPMLGR